MKEKNSSIRSRFEDYNFVCQGKRYRNIFKERFGVKDKKLIINDWMQELRSEFSIPDILKRGKKSDAVFSKIIGPIKICFFLWFRIKDSLATYEISYHITHLVYKNVLDRELDRSNLLDPYIRRMQSSRIIDFGRPRYIKFLEHEDGLYKLCIQDIQQELNSSLGSRPTLPCLGPLTVEDIFNHYRNNFLLFTKEIEYRKKHNLYKPSKESDTYKIYGIYNPTVEERAEKIKVLKGRELLSSYLSEADDYYAHPAIIAAWAGDNKKAKQYFEWGADIMRSHYYEEDNKHKVDDWLTFYGDMINNPEQLRENVRENIKHISDINIEQYGEASINYYDLKDAVYKEEMFKKQ